MSSFLDGLTQPAPTHDLEAWRAQIEQRRAESAARRARAAAATAAASRPSGAVAVQRPAAPSRAPKPAPTPRVTASDQILTLWNAGTPAVDDIAHQVHLTPATVRKHLRAAGHPTRTPRPPKPAKPAPEPRVALVETIGEEVERLYRRGDLGHLAIGRLVGCSAGTVARILQLRGVERLRGPGLRITRPAGGKPKVYDPSFVAQIRELAGRGLTQEQIAAGADTTPKVVSRVMQRYAIPARPAIALEPRDHAAPLKALMAQAGVTTAQVRAWARAHELPIADRGIPPLSLVQAYLDDVA